ncbi:hypothetical protein EON65_21020 [archaeon]|nr:MAG: hypothetical protein EON65_21020 [archaeon]
MEDSAVSGNEETKQASAISSPSEELAAWIAQEKLPQSLVKVLSEHSISSLEQVNGISSEKLITVTKDFKPLARKKIEQCVIAVQQGLTWKEYYARQLSGRDVLEGVQYDGWK